MKSITLLIDGTNLCYKFACKPFNTFSYAGAPTGVIYGFLTYCRTLRKMVTDSGDDVAKTVVVWDTAAPLIKTNAEYKAQRAHSASSDYVHAQSQTVQEVLRHLGCISVRKEGYEADELAYTYVKQHAHSHIMLVSSDFDYASMVRSDRVLLWNWRTQKYEDELTYNYVIYRALIGDHSDNIKGVAGMSEYRALASARRYSSIDELLKSDASLQVHADKIRENARMLTMSEVEGVEWKAGKRSESTVREILSRYGFQAKTIGNILQVAG